MAADNTGNRGEAVADDWVGKVFIAIVTPEVYLRECLVCGELFTRDASQEHTEVSCYPNIEPHEKGWHDCKDAQRDEAYPA
jgi:hypothetical protein